MEILALGPDWIDPDHLIRTLGLVGLLAIVFAECGLLIGFFLPGDSLLFVAGLLVSTEVLSINIWALIGLIFLASVLGNVTGYAIGYKAGPSIFKRPDSRFFKPEYVDKTSEFFARYGGAALIFARFVPIVRTFIPVMAGTSRMPFARFFVFSLVGGFLWATSMTLLGYFLGNVQFIADNLEIMTILLVVLSVVPIWFELRRRTKPDTADESAEPAKD